jgi:hypothetical protein
MTKDSDELGQVIQIRRIVSALPIQRAVVANILGRLPRSVRPNRRRPLPVDNSSKPCCSPRLRRSQPRRGPTLFFDTVE